MKLKGELTLFDFIKTYDDVFDESECNLIISEYLNSDEWERSRIGDGEVNQQIRNCFSIDITNSIGESEIRKKIDSLIYDKVSELGRDYKNIFPTLRIEKDSGYNLLKYDVGGLYTTHTDNYTSSPRTISISITLNDDYEGGELSFFYGEKVIQSKRGSVTMFPSNFMYPHEIKTIKNGTRYAIVTWMM